MITILTFLLISSVTLNVMLYSNARKWLRRYLELEQTIKDFRTPFFKVFNAQAGEDIQPGQAVVMRDDGKIWKARSKTESGV